MKRILLSLLIVSGPCASAQTPHTDTYLKNRLDSLIRGKTFQSTPSANQTQLLIDSKVSVLAPRLFSTSTIGFIPTATDNLGHFTWQAPSGLGLTVGTTPIASGVSTRVLYDNSGVVGEYSVSGSGDIVMTVSPSLISPNIRGAGSGSGTLALFEDNLGNDKLKIIDDGTFEVGGNAGTTGQVLTTLGSGSAPIWRAQGATSIKASLSYQSVDLSTVSLSSTGFGGLNILAFSNKTTLQVKFVGVLIKTDGTSSVSAEVTSRFRKNNSGTWSVDAAGTAVISDATTLSGFVGDINGGNPGVTWITPGTTSGTWQFSYTAIISAVTN